MLASFERRSKLFWMLVGFAFIGGVGILDFLTGYEFAFSIFYWVPISLVTWFAGRRPGIAASLVSACIWFATDVAAGHSYSQSVIYAWNTLIEFSSFLIVVLLLSAFRRALEQATELAHTDYLTGAVNSRFFFELVGMEINRFNRYQRPFTVVYFDIDNFKAVNDQFGHASGDQILRALVDHARKNLRKTDVIARLGGDEFALLLPETDQETAQVLVPKIQAGILKGVQQLNKRVTFSVGALTCIDSTYPPDELVRMVDELMYSVKHGSKNSIIYSTDTLLRN